MKREASPSQRLLFLFLFVFLFLSVFSGLGVKAQTTYYVSPTNGSDANNTGTTLADPFASIQRAFQMPLPPTSLTVVLLPGIHPIAYAISLASVNLAVTIRLDTSADLGSVIVDCGSQNSTASKFLNLSSLNGELTIDGLGVTACGLAILTESSTGNVTVSNSRFFFNKQSLRVVQGSGSVILRNSEFRDNTDSSVSVSGFNRRLYIQSSIFEDNTISGDGGALSIDGINILDIDNSSFIHNAATNAGVMAVGDTAVRISKSNFFYNFASSFAGVYYQNGVADYSNIQVTDSTFVGNSAQNGGVLVLRLGTSSYQNCKFYYNIARDAGGVLYAFRQTATWTNCDLWRNAANRDTGGILYYDFGGSGTFTSCTLGENRAAIGGVAQIGESSSVTFNSGSTIIRNKGLRYLDLYYQTYGTGGIGGVVSAAGSANHATIEFTDCSVADNEADTGAVIAISSTDADMTGCLVKNNKALDSGGIIRASGLASMGITNSLLINNTASNGSVWYCSGPVTNIALSQTPLSNSPYQQLGCYANDIISPPCTGTHACEVCVSGYDACNTCGGTDFTNPACLPSLSGLVNLSPETVAYIPFNPPTNVSILSSGVEASFFNGKPDFQLTAAKDPLPFFLQYIDLQEKQGSNVSKTFDFTGTGIEYRVTQQQFTSLDGNLINNINFTTALDDSSIFKVSNYIFDKTANISFAGINVQLPAAALKLALFISYHFYGPQGNITFNSLASTLTVRVKIGAIGYSDQQISDALSLTYYPNSTDVQSLRLSLAGKTFTGNFLNVALFDGSVTPTPINIQYEGGGIFSFVLPYFAQTVIIDPDFSVTVTPSDDSSDNTDTIIWATIVGVFCTVVIVAVIFAAVVTATTCWLRSHRRKQIAKAIEGAL